MGTLAGARHQRRRREHVILSTFRFTQPPRWTFHQNPTQPAAWVQPMVRTCCHERSQFVDSYFVYLAVGCGCPIVEDKHADSRRNFVGEIFGNGVSYWVVVLLVSELDRGAYSRKTNPQRVPIRPAVYFQTSPGVDWPGRKVAIIENVTSKTMPNPTIFVGAVLGPPKNLPSKPDSMSICLKVRSA